MVQWKMAPQKETSQSSSRSPFFHGTMIMGERWRKGSYCSFLVFPCLRQHIFFFGGGKTYLSSATGSHMLRFRRGRWTLDDFAGRFGWSNHVIMSTDSLGTRSTLAKVYFHTPGYINRNLIYIVPFHHVHRCGRKKDGKNLQRFSGKPPQRCYPVRFKGFRFS